MHLFVLVIGALWIAPIIGLIINHRLRSASVKQTRYVYLTCGAVVTAATLVVGSRWSMRGFTADAYLIAIAYGAYCNLAAGSTSFVKRRDLRFIAATVLAIPVALGYLFGTIGILGIALMLGDFELRSERTLTPQLSYRTYSFGNATTAKGGTAVEVSTHPLWAPFLERRLFRAAYDDRDYDLSSLTVSVDLKEGISFILIKAGATQLAQLRIE